ncbi:zinc-binding dehydrogenase [Streptomyces actinomycinicus]|uniref:Zinc-binding dehydrogenase n=1 Tax=Streptomyces actinomycinicus TaxID=1695166 RepID=A0A937ENQ5_9ACTN|nr:zinc-binding dehydrogenase [Streptomyces actinomycinicus]MBL1086703.1 zinc-binding dehydrogenase [Streptomyces actinomycinicus]
MPHVRGEAAVLVEPGRLEVEEVAFRELKEDEVLVRNALAAICGSDVHRVRAESPFFRDMRDHPYPCPAGYPGHEGIGEVVESRSAKFAPGDFVLTVPNHAYMASFARYQTIADRFLLPVKNTGTPSVHLMAQQLGTVVFALKRFWPEPVPEGRTAAVVGVGSAGLLFLQMLKHRGFEKVVAVDLEPGRLEVARSLGADATALVPGQSAEEVVMEATGGKGADLVIEAAGTDGARAHAVRMVGQQGRLGFFGMPEDYDMHLPYAHLFVRNAHLIHAVGGAQLEPGLASFRTALDLIGDGSIRVDDHITHTFDIKNIADAFDLAHHRGDGVVKVALTFD